jgi:hypothetical protein
MNLAEQFYNTHCSTRPLFPEVPKQLSSDIEIVKWIFTQNIPYIDIDLAIDTAAWQFEASIASESLVPHRENDSTGWNSCCIHGSAVTETGIWNNYATVEPEYQWTHLSDVTPTIKQFWQLFPFENYARIRFMELAPHSSILPHNDSPTGMPIRFDLLQHLIPINIAISHPGDCFMTLKNHGVVPWKTGDVRLVNITNDHSVINFGNESRMHLIAHGIIGDKFDEFCKLIARSYRNQYEHYRI